MNIATGSTSVLVLWMGYRQIRKQKHQKKDESPKVHTYIQLQSTSTHEHQPIGTRYIQLHDGFPLSTAAMMRKKYGMLQIRLERNAITFYSDRECAPQNKNLALRYMSLFAFSMNDCSRWVLTCRGLSTGNIRPAKQHQRKKQRRKQRERHTVSGSPP